MKTTADIQRVLVTPCTKGAYLLPPKVLTLMQAVQAIAAEDGPNAFAVTGLSGAGKTVLLQDLICLSAEHGVKTVVLDCGGSYSKLALFLHGATFRPEPEGALGVNPFWGISTETELVASLGVLREFVLSLVTLGDPVVSCGTAGVPLKVEQAIRRAWGDVKERLGLCEVYNELRRIVGAELFAEQLEVWANGRYNEWFNGQSVLSSKVRIVALDFEKLMDRPKLMAAVSSAALAYSARLATACRMRLIIDETWQILDPQGIEPATGLVSEALDTISRNGSQAGVSMQFLSDLGKTPAGTVILAEAKTQFDLALN